MSGEKKSILICPDDRGNARIYIMVGDSVGAWRSQRLREGLEPSQILGAYELPLVIQGTDGKTYELDAEGL